MTYFDLSSVDKIDALIEGSIVLKRRPNLLEKDIWVVWALNTLFDSPIGENLVFKGGTSLSKVYQIINRFSEDIDLSINIRHLIPELIGDLDPPIPQSRSQAGKWTKIIRARLLELIESQIVPILLEKIKQDNLNVEIVQEDHVLYLKYEPMQVDPAVYISPEVMLEFGGRATGKPSEHHEVACDISAALPNLELPTARPMVMLAERTFLEKALGAHVYCLKGKSRGRQHFARHWHDLDCLDRHFISDKAINDQQLIQAVIKDEEHFYRENDKDGNVIDYETAMSGNICLVPTGDARIALSDDYLDMYKSGMVQSEFVPFDTLMDRLSNLETRINAVSRQLSEPDEKSIEKLDEPSI